MEVRFGAAQLIQLQSIPGFGERGGVRFRTHQVGSHHLSTSPLSFSEEP